MTSAGYFLEVNLEELSAIIRSTAWESENPLIEVLFSNNFQLFTGKVSRDAWKTFAECFEEDPETFFEQNKKALSCPEAAQSYKYSLRNQTDTKVTLIWSKILDGAVAKCGEVELNLCPEKSAFNFVQNCVGIVTQLKQEVLSHKKRALEVEEDSARQTKEYEKIVEGRVAAEEQLFDKFAALLNSKRRKIRALEADN